MGFSENEKEMQTDSKAQKVPAERPSN